MTDAPGFLIWAALAVILPSAMAVWAVLTFRRSAKLNASSPGAIEQVGHLYHACRILGLNALVYERRADGELYFADGLLPAPALEVDMGEVGGKRVADMLAAWGAGDTWTAYVDGLEREVRFRYAPNRPTGAVVAHMPLGGGRAIVAWCHVPPTLPAIGAPDGE